MTYLLPEMVMPERSPLTINTSTELGLYLATELLTEWKRSSDQATNASKRGDHRLIEHLIWNKTTTQEMSDRLRNGIAKWGELLPDIDSDQIISDWRRKRGI